MRRDTRQNRLQGLGPLTGLVAGIGSGFVLAPLGQGLASEHDGRVRGRDAARPDCLQRPMTVLGLTDPRTWPTSSRVADIIPHAAYGAVTALVLDRLDPRSDQPLTAWPGHAGRARESA